MQHETTLIIGNSGKTGKRVEQKLNALGVGTRGVSRSSAIPFDWYKTSTWKAALEGTTSAYVTFQPDLAVPGAVEIIRAFCELAKAVGVQKVVLLSGRGEEGAQKAEQVLINSGLQWNVVRASWFAQNFSEGFMLDGILSGELILPESNTLEPFIDVDDIADVAVAALTRNNLKNRLFEVTGPRLMTFADCIDAISKATGRPIRFTQVTIDEYLTHLKTVGLPEEVLWLMNELFTEIFDGRNASVATGVKEATGKDATDFEGYLKKALAADIWSTQTWPLTAKTHSLNRECNHERC